ncbi:2-phosphosulfolactate phosphatase [Nocardia terpenica]|uniref:2-phosphosulfolactate phosphatase n=1 Tax=Nocardia terpenica TaxID=455432 RepID=UPI0018945400|nr:2-phosphosulfolactate phosphatase [Nocardia terpenica]MBF6059499.1 2-phosphosulfolactate phosphatase [Nocardia terpenica]MBF6102962.1 2-phosphosulfolactate phosphatase [Nocardia terpenica]MBF6110849.1 2-phosphosulfolactate phosphatase [Nocardia terpenica]MBF6116980.1 2-phosphosulfolactate phosphatase [Nocardia terpenica]MBF6151182.1 2-phosphosulfolactate phosphatase [Nocardia terpenica]
MTDREWATQRPWGVRVDWGRAGALALGPGSACVVVVDVLSFTTAVSVAIERGTQVIPYPWRDDSAAAFAANREARLAVGRHAVSAERPWSLSPAALREAPAPRRLVLPSPNGSSIAAAVSAVPVIAACLRNATAVGRWIRGQGWGTAEKPVSVIAAGEHWGDGSLRPALEDWLGAGAVVSALAAYGAGPLSPEALVAKGSHDGAGAVAAVVARCASGCELAALGFGDDVRIAVEIDESRVVPVLSEGAFADAT